MSRTDREACSFVPFRRRAGVVGRWTLATEFIETPAFACALVIESVRELPAIIKWPAIATIVNCLAIKRGRPSERVQIGDPFKGQVIQKGIDQR